MACALGAARSRRRWQASMSRRNEVRRAFEQAERSSVPHLRFRADRSLPLGRLPPLLGFLAKLRAELRLGFLLPSALRFLASGKLRFHFLHLLVQVFHHLQVFLVQRRTLGGRQTLLHRVLAVI